MFREVGDHVAAVHLAVHEDVDAELLLEADPVLGGLAPQAVQLLGVDLLTSGFAAGLSEVVRLWVAADGGGE